MPEPSTTIGRDSTGDTRDLHLTEGGERGEMEAQNFGPKRVGLLGSRGVATMLTFAVDRTEIVLTSGQVSPVR